MTLSFSSISAFIGVGVIIWEWCSILEGEAEDLAAFPCILHELLAIFRKNFYSCIVISFFIYFDDFHICKARV